MPQRDRTLRDAGAIAALDHQDVWAIKPESLFAIESAAARADLVSLLERQAAEPEPEAAVTPPIEGGTVAVIRIRGVITPRPSILSMLFGGGAGGLASLRAMFGAAIDDDSIGSIVLDVDSPGGVMSQVPETAAVIRAARGTKPIIAIANTMAASAAYWLASQADEIVVTPSGQVGSIGAVIRHAEFSRMDEEAGITVTTIRKPERKQEANAYEPLSERAAAHLQHIVDESYAMFVADVAKGRGVKASDVRKDYGEGTMLLPKDALAAGMVDRIETFDEVVSRLVNGRGRRRATTKAAVQDDEAEPVVEDIETPAVENPPAADPPPAVDPPAPPAADDPPPPDGDDGGAPAAFSPEERRAFINAYAG